MKLKIFNIAFVLSAALCLTGCSNLFENIINEDLSFKKGDDSLTSNPESEERANISSGLVVLKNTEKTVNQIIYKPEQTTYFVGKVPAAYSDYKVNYSNGTKVSLYGKNDPIELRCFPNDSNASVKWELTQTWEYLPKEKVVTSKDSAGNEVTYRGIESQSASKLKTPRPVYFKKETKAGSSIIFAELPYGVTVATCTVLADDAQYQTVYTIILTKEYITTVANSNTPDDDANNVTNHGVVVIKASDPGRNAINYSSTIYEYEVGDSTGKNTALDLTGRDDPVIFKCFTLDDNAELTWKAIQTKEYIPEWDSNKGGVISQELKELDSPVTFDFVKADESHEGQASFMQFISDKSNELKSNLPYGVTEVYATITAYNTDENGELIPNVGQYKITLTKRYIITTATNTHSKGDNTGLAVYANGKSGNLIDYKPTVLKYSVENLSGANDPVTIEFRPEEPDFTEVIWTAEQTHSYNPEIHEVSNGKVTYTYQNGGKFTELKEAVNLLESDGTKARSQLSIEKKDDAIICQGNLPYGITVITVTDKSLGDADSATSYTIVLSKKQVSTNVNIISSSGEEMSTVTDRGLVVLSAQDENLNKISFNPNQTEYELKNIQATDNDMKFLCYLADTDAEIEWKVLQTKTFSPIKSVYEKTIYDSFMEKTQTVRYEYISGQLESLCENQLDFRQNPDSEGNEIIAEIPYGITEVIATISSKNEKTSIYKISLRRDICAESVSESDFIKNLEDGIEEGNYSKLKDLNIEIKDNEDDSTLDVKLEPEFSPEHTTYTVKVDEDSDNISIEAIAAADNAQISAPTVITKYGEVPPLDDMKINLVGGKTRITFTVTDETQISRTYTIYVEKPEDGDTTLKYLEYTPDTGFENGVEGFTLDTSFKGALDTEAEKAAAKYKMTLSADSRKSVSAVTFKALPDRKRTSLSFGISDSASSLPTEWSSEYSQGLVGSKTVTLGDDELNYINKVLWIKTVSDAYYHLTADKKSYESEKRQDTTYHKILLTKAGNLNQELTALVALVTYEDGTSEKLLDFTSPSKVAFKTEDKTLNVSTYADKIDFYFRPLDKDAKVTYSAINTIYDGDTENTNTSFTGYSKEAASPASSSVLKKISENCEFLNDSSNEYYKLTVGQIEEGLSSTKDLPRGTTAVTICGRTYTFIKPDLKDVNYKLGDLTGKGDRKWEYYIYLKNSEDSLEMNLSTAQQNQVISINSCEHTAGINEKPINDADKGNPAASIIHASDNGGKLTDWTVTVTDIPVGTTALELNIRNQKNSANCTYYIIRAGNTETRLKSLSFAGTTPSAFKTDWNNKTENKGGMKEDSYTYIHDKTLNVDAGIQTLKVEPVNPDAYITITRRHSAVSGITAVNDENAAWSEPDTKIVSGRASQNKGILEYAYTFTDENADDNAGSILYTISLAPSEEEAVTHTYYLLVHVQADKTAQLNALKIIQKGDENSEDRIILSNSFEAASYNYPELYASLNYTGSIIITPVKYPKAKITGISLKLAGEDLENPENYIEENGVITIPYAEYINQLGKTYSVSYKIQAQDTSVSPVIYTAEIHIPEYTVITESENKLITEEKSFTIPDGITGGLGYRFGSVISDNSIPVKDYFGGIDIIGSSDGETWYESSFGGSGMQFALNIDGKDYWAKLNQEGKLEKLYTYDGKKLPEEAAIPEGINFEVTPKFVSENDDNYLELKLSVENANNNEIKLAAAIDTLIGTLEESTDASNDSVTVKETNNGFTMEGNDFTFSVILKNAYSVDDVDSLWYGPYQGGDYLMKVFENNLSGLNKDEDSAASFYWNLGSRESAAKTIRITMKAKPSALKN